MGFQLTPLLIVRRLGNPDITVSFRIKQKSEHPATEDTDIGGTSEVIIADLLATCADDERSFALLLAVKPTQPSAQLPL